MNVFTKILYCDKGTSDKVYIVTVNKINNQFVVTTSWGARTDADGTSKIKGTYTNEYTAVSMAERLARKKTDYRPHPDGLKIYWYKPDAVSIAQIAADSAQVATAVIKNNMPAGRKIKL